MTPRADLMHFVVYFEDGSVVQGNPLGSPDTGWNHLPDKPISKLAYINPYGDTIVLQGYQEYNHMLECLMPMGQRPYITDVYLMGAKACSEHSESACSEHSESNAQVVVYRLNAFQKTPEDPIQVGDVSVRVCPRGREYLDSETWGWRKGAHTAEAVQEEKCTT